MSLRNRISSLLKPQENFDLTSGSIGKPLLFLSIPVVVTNLFQTAYNLADTFWLGQYSTDALAAISFAYPMAFLLISLGLGISVAGSVLVAQFTGAGEDRQAEYAASQTVTFAIVAAALLGGIGYFFVEDLLSLMGASADILPAASSYMEIISLGIVFMFGFFIFISLMRGYGDTTTPMLVTFGSVVLNIVLDPFVIFGWWVFPEMGIQGAAIATIFSRALAMVIGLAIMFRGTRGIQIHLCDMFPNPSYIVRLARIGGPTSIEGAATALSENLLLVVVATFTDPTVAAYGIGVRVFSVVFQPATSVARGVETMTGQNIGAGKPDRVERAAGLAATTMFGVLTVVGILVFMFSEPIVSVFVGADQPGAAQVVETGGQFLRYVALTFGFMGIMRIYAGSFRGAGKTVTAAVIAILILGVIRFPLAWTASGPLNETGIWLAFAVTNIIGAIIAYVWYRRGTWRDTDLTESEVDVDSLTVDVVDADD